jgi:hypothetical protein
MIEEWRSIDNFPDYIISNKGKLKRVTTVGRWKKGHQQIPKSNGNYLFFTLYNNGSHKQRYVHALVLEAFVSPCPKGYECNHKDGNKLNNNLDNLEWTTHSKNELHAYEMGLVVGVGAPGRVGILHPLHKLTNDDVRSIRDLLKTGRTQKSLAISFNVAQTTISKINLRKRWRHLR